MRYKQDAQDAFILLTQETPWAEDIVVYNGLWDMRKYIMELERALEAESAALKVSEKRCEKLVSKLVDS